jgi:molybdenum cofactor synthesis domain-containing protein
MITLGILTISTSTFGGDRNDSSGEIIKELLRAPLFQLHSYEVVPDGIDVIERKLKYWADRLKLNLIVTTGGTGLGSRDVTPEACKKVFHKEVPGLGEVMRSQTFDKTPLSMLSRSVAGIRKATLIVTLPGSPKAVKECLKVIIPIIPHAIDILINDRGHDK